MVNNGHCLFPEDCDLWVSKPWAGSSAKGKKKLKWNCYKKIQDKNKNDVPRWCRAWKPKVYFEMNKYWVWQKRQKQKKIIHRQTSRQMEFIITKKDGQKIRQNEAGWNKMNSASETGQGREGSNKGQRMRGRNQLQQRTAMKNYSSTWPSCSPLQWQSHQVDHIHCCPTVSLCQLAVCSEVVNTRVSIFHHTLTLGQADKWLFRNKARLNPQVSGRIREPGMIGLFNSKISALITYECISVIYTIWI